MGGHQGANVHRHAIAPSIITMVCGGLISILYEMQCGTRMPFITLFRYSTTRSPDLAFTSYKPIKETYMNKM